MSNRDGFTVIDVVNDLLHGHSTRTEIALNILSKWGVKYLPLMQLIISVADHRQSEEGRNAYQELATRMKNNTLFDWPESSESRNENGSATIINKSPLNPDRDKRLDEIIKEHLEKMNQKK